MQSVHNRGLLVISVSHLRSGVGAGIDLHAGLAMHEQDFRGSVKNENFIQIYHIARPCNMTRQLEAT